MEYAISEISERVLVALGESPSYLECHVEFDGDSGVDIRRRIEVAVVSEARRLILDTPLDKINEWKRFTAPVSYSTSGLGTINLPEDYLRFVSIRMEGWESAVTQLMPTDSPWFRVQMDRYRRGWGMARRPHAIYGAGPYGRTLTILGALSGARMEAGAYLPDPVAAVTLPDHIWLPATLLDPLVAAVTRLIASEPTLA